MLTGFKLHIITTSLSWSSSKGTNSAKPLTTVLGSEKYAAMVNDTSWLVRSSPNRAVWIRARDRKSALCSWARQCLFENLYQSKL